MQMTTSSATPANSTMNSSSNGSILKYFSPIGTTPKTSNGGGGTGQNQIMEDGSK
jgi:hypothetical protein